MAEGTPAPTAIAAAFSGSDPDGGNSSNAGTSNGGNSSGGNDDAGSGNGDGADADTQIPDEPACDDVGTGTPTWTMTAWDKDKHCGRALMASSLLRKRRSGSSVRRLGLRAVAL
ncbi:MAG TPA: hypothetical protein VHO25_16895 [Polyangiaceae bacterium]|nr:hypothetical protein [Polyangiaceae bacterium]